MKHLKLFFALFAMLALGVGSAWAQTFTRISSASDLADGDEIIFVDQAGTYACGTTQQTNNRTLVAIETNDNSYSYQSSDNVQVFVVKKNGTNYGFHTGAGYIYSASSSKNNLKTNTTASTTSPTGTSAWTLSVSDNVFTVKNVTNTSYYLALNLSNNPKLFSQYKSGQSKPYIYKKQSSSSSEPLYSVTVKQPTTGGTISATGLTEGKAAAGAIVELTATPDASYKWESWTVTGASGDVVVSNNQFTMPAEDVTVTASFVAKEQYTIKWNVAEGSVADTKVYEGEALGSLPPAPNCSEGKVFVGWTEATSVNADGSGLVLAKATDVPAGNKEYNAVYATAGATVDKVDILNLSFTGASGSTYSDWSGKKSVSNAVYAGNNAGGNSAIQLRSNNSTSGIVTTTSGGKLKKVVVTWNSNTSDGRTLDIYGNNTAYTAASNLYSTSTDGDKLGTIVKGTSTELEITDDYEFIGLRSYSSAMYLDEIQITWSATSYSDYSLDCEARQDPFLTVSETEIEFGQTEKDATVTETFAVTGGYLAEDVALTLTGSGFFSVSAATIAKADEVNETVTVTYNPTEVGEHTATLTIKTGDITKKITLSGTVLAPGKWVLVKDIATLSAGDEIIIAAATDNYAIGEAASNNYKGAAITKVGETANAEAGVTVLTVEETGVAEAPYAFKAGSNYLYAASSSANQLKGKTTLDDHGKWAVTITAEGVASIEAAKSTNRKVMQYNPNSGSPIFACYETASQKALAIYRNSENVVKPVISGKADFVGSTDVTITAQSGLTVYYTTDGTDPDNTSTVYSAPFTINATTTVKAIAYDASSNASSVAEMTFTKHNLVDVATAMALAKDEVAYFDEFEVVKVVTGKGNIYIKDASGHGLIYDNTLADELNDGDRVQGFVGISSPYKGLPEAKPVDGLTVADLTITSGVAAEPYDFTSTAITADDLNKYIVFKEVPMDADVDVTTHPTLTINGNSVNFRNTFNVTKTLENGKKYDIYGFVSIYNENLQVSFYQALEQGEVVKTYTVTYNTGGATGEVPVDNNEYIAGAQVWLKSAADLTLEGYEFASWKVTDESANEINVVENKFNMPASNVTVTAQWEEIVVTPKKDFSEGYWVLVTEASELNADDYIIVAAANLDVAMKSYESGNYCTHMTVEKDGIQLKWDVNLGVFQLAKDNENYTIQDVNTEQYLYAAGSGDKNYLKAANEIPTDADDVKKFIWTITIEDGVTTVKATSENRNTLQYNKTSGQERFSCYASGQEAIALYKYVTELPTPTLTITDGDNSAVLEANNGQNVNVEVTREFTTGNLYTISLPFALNNVSDIFGNVAYEYSSLAKNGDDVVLYFSKVNTMEAGKPYLIEPTKDVHGFTVENVILSNTTNNISFFVDATAVSMEAVLSASASATTEGKYWLATNKYLYNNSTTLKSLRALFTISTPSGIAPRVRVALEENGETGFENITAPAGKTVKAIVNGQLIIIRDGEKFNAQGQKL